MPLIVAISAALRRSASVGTVPLSVATPLATDTLMSYFFNDESWIRCSIVDSRLAVDDWVVVVAGACDAAARIGTWLTTSIAAAATLPMTAFIVNFSL